MRPIQGSAADLATLATLGSVLPAVERPFGLPCRRSSAALCELAGPSQIGLGDRSRFSVRVMTIARPPRQGNALRFRLALGLTARSQSASRGSRAAGGCIGSTRSACEPRWAKPGLGETGRHQPRMVVVRRQFGRKPDDARHFHVSCARAFPAPQAARHVRTLPTPDRRHAGLAGRCAWPARTSRRWRKRVQPLSVTNW